MAYDVLLQVIVGQNTYNSVDVFRVVAYEIKSTSDFLVGQSSRIPKSECIVEVNLVCSVIPLSVK